MSIFAYHSVGIPCWLGRISPACGVHTNQEGQGRANQDPENLLKQLLVGSCSLRQLEFFKRVRLARKIEIPPSLPEMQMKPPTNIRNTSKSNHNHDSIPEVSRVSVRYYLKYAVVQYLLLEVVRL